MNEEISLAISARCVVILRQLQKDGVPGVVTARRALEDLGLSAETIRSMITDTIARERAYARFLQ